MHRKNMQTVSERIQMLIAESAEMHERLVSAVKNLLGLQSVHTLQPGAAAHAGASRWSCVVCCGADEVNMV